MTDDRKGEEGRAAVSSEATGGIGVNYEGAALAVYLAALLAESAAPGCPGRLTHVSAQRGPERPLDDLVLDWQDELDRSGMLDLQLKRRVTVSDIPAGAFASIVAASWATIGLAGFQQGRDLAGGLTEVIALDAALAIDRLGELARLAIDAADFLAEVNRQQTRWLRDVFAAVKTILHRETARTPTSDQLLLFWRHFVMVRVEATSARGRDRLYAADSLRPMTRGTATTAPLLFGALEALAKQLNVAAARVDRAKTIELLRERFSISLAPLSPDARDALRQGRKGAETELRLFREQRDNRLIEPELLSYERRSDGAPVTPRRVPVDEIETELREARTLTLLGEPGGGKSNALEQIAVALLSRSDLVPIVRSLPDLTLRGRPLVSQVCGEGAFRGLSEDGFALLAEAGRVALLLDGWNELNAAQKQWAWGELNALQRGHPALLILIASRSGTATPFAAGATLELQPFDRERQYEAAERLLGTEGRQLLKRARAVPTLRPLLRTPIFLAAILAQGASGTLPASREEVIAGLVAEAGDQARREQLRLALDGQHLAILSDVAWAMMIAGTTTMDEPAVIRIIADSLAGLRARHLFVKPASPVDVLEALLSHHLMVAAVASGTRTIRLQHQLIQEWFASHRLDVLIVSGQAGEAWPELLRRLDSPSWRVAILLSVERLARTSGALAALRTMILVTLGIEPFLAAEMLQRTPGIVTPEFEEIIARFAREWATGDLVRATRFMLLTGLKRFGPELWADLVEQDQLAFGMHSDTRGFPLAGLLPGWADHFPKLKSQTRRVMLIALVEQGEADGLALAVAAAANDPSLDVVRGVLEYLDFSGEDAFLERLLDALPPPMWSEIVRGRELEHLTTAHAARWRETKRKRFDEATGGEWIELALEFGCAEPRQVIAAALDLKSDAHWYKHGLEERLAERFPAEFRAILVERILARATVPYRADELLEGFEPGQQAALLRLAIDDDAGFHEREIVGRLLGARAVALLMKRLLRTASESDPAARKRRQRTADALNRVRLDLLIGAILAHRPGKPHLLRACVDVLSRWKHHGEPRRFSLDETLHGALVGAVREWTAILLADARGLRWGLADLAVVIGRLGGDDLLPLLLALWDRDRARGAEERAAWLADRSVQNEACMVYDTQYRDALIAIGGPAVIKAMTQRLADPAFELDAAVILGEMLAVHPRPDGPVGAGLNDLADRRSARAKLTATPPHPIAAQIAARIETLIGAGDPESIDRAVHLAGPLSRMNLGDIAIFPKLLHAARDHGRLVHLAECLAKEGEALPAEIVRHGFDRSLDEIKAKGWAHENDYWRVEAWLRLIAFADDALAALPDLDRLAGEPRFWRRLEKLVHPLGYSVSSTALAALQAVLARFPELRKQSSAWAQAMAQLGTHEAADALLDAFVEEPDDDERHSDPFALRQALTSALEARSPARKRAFDLLETLENPRKQTALADAIAQSMDETDAVRLLTIAVRPKGDGIARVLAGRLDQAAVERLPVEGSANTYELESRPLSTLRKLAFGMLGQPHADAARMCLAAIDLLRDEYGKPEDEPNHPNLASGKPWPEEAAAAWEASRLAIAKLAKRAG